MTLGQFIINHRKSKNLSQRQFAALCNVSNGYIAMVEKGLNPKTKKPIIPTLMQLKKLASGMGISVSELIDAVDDMPVVLSASGKTSSRNPADNDDLLNKQFKFTISLDHYPELREEDIQMLQDIAQTLVERRKKENQPHV